LPPVFSPASGFSSQTVSSKSAPWRAKGLPAAGSLRTSAPRMSASKLLAEVSPALSQRILEEVYATDKELYRVAVGDLAAAAVEFEMAVNLSILRDDHVFYLAVVEPPSGMTPISLIGERGYLHSTAMGAIPRRDTAGRYRFISGQSALGQALFRHYELEPGDFETVLLIEDGRAWGKLDMVRRDRRLVPLAVEEALRWEPPVCQALRTPVRPSEVAGYGIAPGDSISLGLSAIHRDPSVHPQPSRLDECVRDPWTARAAGTEGVPMCDSYARQGDKLQRHRAGFTRRSACGAGQSQRRACGWTPAICPDCFKRYS